MEDVERGHAATEDDGLEAVTAREGVDDLGARVDELGQAPEGDALERTRAGDEVGEQADGVGVDGVPSVLADGVAAELELADEDGALGVCAEGGAEGAELGVGRGPVGGAVEGAAEGEVGVDTGEGEGVGGAGDAGEGEGVLGGEEGEDGGEDVGGEGEQGHGEEQAGTVYGHGCPRLSPSLAPLEAFISLLLHPIHSSSPSLGDHLAPGHLAFILPALACTRTEGGTPGEFGRTQGAPLEPRLRRSTSLSSEQAVDRE